MMMVSKWTMNSVLNSTLTMIFQTFDYFFQEILMDILNETEY